MSAAPTTVVSWTLRFLRPYRGQAVAILALSILEIGLAVLAPWPLKVIVDYVLGGLALPDNPRFERGLWIPCRSSK